MAPPIRTRQSSTHDAERSGNPPSDINGTHQVRVVQPLLGLLLLPLPRISNQLLISRLFDLANPRPTNVDAYGGNERSAALTCQ